LLTDQVSC